MAAGVVTVGHRQYASGLYWENSPSGRISQAAKEAARQPGAQAEFYAARSGNKQGRVPQFGLAPTALGFHSGMPSLAGCLANQQPGSWIGAFRFREGTAVVVVRDDLLVPDGDLFFADETEARDHVYQEMAVGGFQKVYAPEAWGVPGADTMPVTLLLNERTDVKLHGVVMSKQAKTVVGIGAFVLFCIIGVGWYLQYQEARQQELQRKAIEAKALQDKIKRMMPVNQEPKYPDYVREWEKHPRPIEMITACQAAFTEVKTSVAGWKISGVDCTEGGLSIKWLRNGGFAEAPSDFAINDMGKGAVSSVPLKDLKPRGGEALVDPSVITARYLNQNWPGELRHIADDPLPKPPQGYRGKWNPPPAPWVKRSFTFTVPVLPWTLPVFLDGVPGITIKTVSLRGNGADARNTWKVEGVIYENRR
ncbi:MAG: type 4b pilus protein PilO2 [Alphaproteobacteria bacterium]|nr:type 4b pilus protein PilO2 [Alphaproteobacteria bacterium]